MISVFIRTTGHGLGLRRWLLVWLLVLAVGCAIRDSQVTYHDPNMDFGLLQNVAVMPFANLTPVSQAAARVRNVFMTMLQATEALYVLPPGEVERGVSRSSISRPEQPSPEQVMTFARTVGADAVITGTIREYGQVRSGTSSANVISLSLQMMEAETGRVVWSASATKGGIGAANRLFGGGGKPMNVVTQEAVKELLDKLFSN
jgi:hypothetical protein